MEYLLGGCTGLLKEVETRNKTLLRLSQINDQSLDKNVTCLSWSGGFGGYFEDELTVGYKDGTLRSYNYLTMNVNREYKLDSKCIYLTMLNFHFDIFSSDVYKRNTNSNLYPNTKRPSVYDSNDRLLLAVSEDGYIYIFDWSVEKSDNITTVKYLYKTKDVKVENEKNKDSSGHNSSKVEDLKEFVGALFVYRYKAPLSDARVHSLMRNRLVVAGPNNPPSLFDLFSESILWTGKFPHDTVLGLQSKFNISSVCFLEEIDDDTICVATDDSFVYVYDLKAQRDPVFEFNICDYRTIGLSKKLLSLPHEDFNTKHRRTLARSINEKYSQNNRKILELTTKPSYKLHLTKLDSKLLEEAEKTQKEEKQDYKDRNHHMEGKKEKEELTKDKNCIDSKDEEDLYKVNEHVYIKHYNFVKKDYCNLYISDNFGTIYNLQFLTGDRLLQWIYRKIHPLLDHKLSHTLSDSDSAVTGDVRAKRALEHNTIGGKNTTTNSKDKENNTNMNLEDIKKLSNKDKYKIVEHLIEARKRLCSSSNNDKRIHFRRNHYSQFVCRILCCYNFHNGSVVDLRCLGDYLVSAGLDRFSNVINIRTGKLVFRQYCNQKQTCILVKNKYLFETFQDNLEFKLNEKELIDQNKNESKSTKCKDSKDRLEDDDLDDQINNSVGSLSDYLDDDNELSEQDSENLDLSEELEDDRDHDLDEEDECDLDTDQDEVEDSSDNL